MNFRIIFLLFIFSFPPLLGAQSKYDKELLRNRSRLKQLQEEIELIKEQISLSKERAMSINEQIAMLDKELALLAHSRGLLERESRLLVAKVRETNKLLKSTQARFDLLKILYAQRLIYAYKYGRVRYLELLLTAESFNQAIIRYKYLRLIAEQDERILHNLEKKKRQIEKLKKQLSIDLDNKHQNLMEKQIQQNRYIERMRERQAVLKKIRWTQSTYKKRLAQKELERKKLNGIIRLLEKQRLEREQKPLKDDFYTFDEKQFAIVGQATKKMYTLGDEVTVKVLNLDLERERVSLGLKQLVPDPWTTAEEKYPIASHVKGRVVSFTDYGAFVELEKGIEGLIHVSEMSWTKKVRHPSKVVSVGEIVEAVVLNISAENRRISLGMKQVVPNPWDVVGEKYPVGTTIEGKIKNITDFGAFIGIDEGIDGLVHISDISWTKRIKHPSELYKKGDVVQAIVLNIDKENERFSLGIKQLQRDPWETIPERYAVGDKITGTITNVTDFGLFVELEEGIEGLIHVSEVSREKIKTPVGRFQVGDIVSAKVININPKERRIGLSIKQFEMEEERDLVVNYLSTYKGSESSLGEVLKENLKEKTPNQEPAGPPSETSADKVQDSEVKNGAEVAGEDKTGIDD